MTPDIRDRFRAAMRRFTSTVTVITTGQNGQRHGMTATAVSSVSMEPPSLLICVNRGGRLFELLESCERFCVNVLHSEHVSVSRIFAEPHSADRFVHGSWQTSGDGIPYLGDAQVAIFCAKSLTVAYGSHSVYFGNVEDIRLRDDISPLLYQNGAYGICESLWQADESLLAELAGWG
jgi:flavin reductase (DIM6/NTAB) family NADH-FMN oxidoreductase RutF